MSTSLDGKLVVAISSRALFDFEEENLVFEQTDDRAYMALQLQRLDIPARPGVAFSLVKKLLSFNTPTDTPALDSRLRGNDGGHGHGHPAVMPAQAGIQGISGHADAAALDSRLRGKDGHVVASGNGGEHGHGVAFGNVENRGRGHSAVMPAQAGIQGIAGRADAAALDSRLRGNDVESGNDGKSAASACPVEVVILSRNDPVSGMRVFRSARHYGLVIERGVFTRGQSPWRYLKPLHANLFLSTHLSDVSAALAAGVPAAQVYPHSALASDAHPDEVRIAFDGDAVLFSDEAERVYQAHGLSAFQQHEVEKAAQPLPDGPFKPLLAALQRLQQLQRAGSQAMRIRTALVTARSAPAHERAIRTLMNWNIEVDEAIFLGGLPKGEFLREFEPDFFFDDQTGHIESAARHVPSGHVASGVRN